MVVVTFVAHSTFGWFGFFCATLLSFFLLLFITAHNVGTDLLSFSLQSSVLHSITVDDWAIKGQSLGFNVSVHCVHVFDMLGIEHWAPDFLPAAVAEAVAAVLIDCSCWMIRSIWRRWLLLEIRRSKIQWLCVNCFCYCWCLNPLHLRLL